MVSSEVPPYLVVDQTLIYTIKLYLCPENKTRGVLYKFDLHKVCGKKMEYIEIF